MQFKYQYIGYQLISCEWPWHTVGDIAHIVEDLSPTCLRHFMYMLEAKKKIKIPYIDVDKMATRLRAHRNTLAKCLQIVLSIRPQISEYSLFRFSWRSCRQIFTRLWFGNKFVAKFTSVRVPLARDNQHLL